MAKISTPRTVQCYHCRHRFEVSGRAESTSCPKCNKPLFVANVDVTGRRGPMREIRTCGKVTVGKRGRLICEFIEAHGGVDCLGIIQARRIVSGALVTVGPKAQIKGDVTAPRLSIQLGAKIQGGQYAVPDDPLDVDNPPRGTADR